MACDFPVYDKTYDLNNPEINICNAFNIKSGAHVFRLNPLLKNCVHCNDSLLTKMIIIASKSKMKLN